MVAWAVWLALTWANFKVVTLIYRAFFTAHYRLALFGFVAWVFINSAPL